MPHWRKEGRVFRTFGEGYLNVLVFRAVRRLDHFSVISPINRFKSRGPIKQHHQIEAPALSTSPKLAKSLNPSKSVETICGYTTHAKRASCNYLPTEYLSDS